MRGDRKKAKIRQHQTDVQHNRNVKEDIHTKDHGY